MIADISFLERSIEEKQKRAREKFRARRRTPLYTLVALCVIVTGTLGGYLSLHAATSIRRAPLVFQGRITDANYVPIADTSTRRMVFRIYSAATAGSCLWSTGNAADTAEATNCAIDITAAGDNASEDNASVATTITRGVFSVPLGDTAYHANMRSLRLDFNNASDEVYYLEISVKNASGEYETLSPRIRVGSSAYAYNADELDGADSSQFLGGKQFNPIPSTFTTLNGAHTNAVTTITVASTSGYPFAGTLLIDDEIVTYTGTTSTTFTGVTRARHGTTAAAHSSGALVRNYLMLAASSATATPLVRLTASNAMSNGNVLHISIPPTTLVDSAVLRGSMIDMYTTGVAFTFPAASATPITLLGQSISMPTVNNDKAGIASATQALTIGSGSITRALAAGAGTDSWTGILLTMPNTTQLAGTVTSYGIYVARDTAITSGTTYALITDPATGNIGFGTATPTSYVTITQPAVAGGKTAFALTPGAHTAVTAEVIDFNSIGHALATPLTLTGGIATQRFNVFAPSTVTASSAQIVADAATVAITGAPNAVDAGSATITTSSALHIYRDNGTTPLTDNITNAYSLYVEKPSGGVSGADYTAYFETGGTTGVGIGTATPATALDISGDLAMRVSAFTASNGSNDNISIGAVSFVRVAGPTGVFNIAGIAGGVNGKVVVLYNSTAQNMTITNNGASTAANGILTGTGGDIATIGTGSVTLIYSSTDSRWIVIAVNQ